MNEFYIKKNDEISGPYTTAYIINMSLTDNTFISNNRNGEWISLNEYNWSKKGDRLRLIIEKFPKPAIKENEYIFNGEKLEEVESKIGLNKKQCPYTIDIEYVKKLHCGYITGICEPTYYVFPSGFIVGLVEGAKIFPRFLNDEVPFSINEILCIVLLDKEQNEFASYLLHPSPSSLYALGRTGDNTEVVRIAHECNASYRWFIISTYRAICFGESNTTVWPYNMMRPFGVTNAHSYGDTYGTDSLRYNFYKVFIQPNKVDCVDLIRNPLLSVYYMKDQQWQNTYPIAKDIIRKLAQLFFISDNENVALNTNNIEGAFWGQDGKKLICCIYTNIKKLAELYTVNVLKELFNSFYFWEHNIKLSLHECYIKKTFSNSQNRILEFYLPSSFSNYSIVDLGDLMIEKLNVPDDESKLLRQDWCNFSERTERQKLALALKEGRKIYVTKSGKITLDPKDTNGESNMIISKGIFAFI